MSVTLLCLFGLVAAANAVTLGHPGLAYGAAPLAAKVAVADDYDPHPQYSYSYSVADGLTGDSKSHQESRDGDVVSGSYSVADPDGTLRTVTYTADPVHGFNAVVDRQAGAVAVAKTPVLAHHGPAVVGHHAAPAFVGHHAAPLGVAPHYARAVAHGPALHHPYGALRAF